MVISVFSIVIYFSFIVLVTKQLEEVMYFEFSYEELMSRYELVRAIIEWASNGFRIMCAFRKNKAFKSIWVVSIGVRNM
jgi:hypothetical protein